MQDAVVRPVVGMTKQDLDYLFDADANSIGALLPHWRPQKCTIK